VRPQHHRVVVALVERDPGDGAVRGLAGAPGGQQRRLAEAGGRGDEAQLEPAPRAQAVEQPVARHGLARHGGRVELGQQQEGSVGPQRAEA
jgi:hypothetical protein